MASNSNAPIKHLAKDVADSPALQERFKADPVAALQEVASTAAYEQDITFYRWALGALGVVALVCTIGVILLALMNSASETAMTALVAFGSASVGGIAGLFTAPKTQ